MERCTYFEGGKWRIRLGDTEYSGLWVDRLAAYEDAIPFADLPRAAELVKADDKGLCVVLNEPRKPLISDDDLEAFRCPYCGIDLMGIPYGDRMLLQCPECGEYVDGTKAITRAEAEAALADK